MILPDWHIRNRCVEKPKGWGADWPEPMISPFCERSVHAETGMSFGLSSGGYDFRIKQNRTLNKGDFCLASTVERFVIPRDVMPFIHDKSTLARQGISIFNTCAEAGWQGWLTIEIVCHGPGPIRLIAGQPIGQMVFHQMLAAPERTYAGGSTISSRIAPSPRSVRPKHDQLHRVHAASGEQPVPERARSRPREDA